MSNRFYGVNAVGARKPPGKCEQGRIHIQIVQVAIDKYNRFFLISEANDNANKT